MNKQKTYLQLLGNHIIKTNLLSGKPKKQRDRIIKNRMKGIVSFEYKGN